MSEHSLGSPYQTRLLSELAARITDGSHFSPVPQISGHLIANVKDMNSGKINFDSCTRISPSAYRELLATGCIIKKGDVLLSKDGTVGRVVVYAQEEEIGALSSICLITPKPDANSKFIGQALQSNGCIRQYDNLMSGSALRRLVLRDIRNIVVAAPPIECQAAIAEVLDTLDTLIFQTEAIIEKLKQVKQGLLHDLMTRGIDSNGELRPLQSRAPHLYKNSPVGLVPCEWTVELLDSVADRGSGHTPSKSTPSYWNGGIKWVSLADSHRLDQIYITETDKEISELGLANSSAVKHQAGTVIVSRDAGVGKSAILAAEMAVSQHFIAWRCGQRLNSLYLYFVLQRMKPMFESIAIGSTIKTIGLSFFKNLRIVVPARAEQERIVEILLSNETALQTHSDELTKLRLQKSGLMDDLLTGRVRVTPLLDTLGA